MRIAVDIDDTLNVLDRAGKAGAYIKRKNLPFHLADEYAHVFADVYDWTPDDVLEFIRDGGITTFTDAELRPYARQVMESWKRAGDEIIVLTARMKEWFGNPERLSRDWLEKRRVPYDEIAAEVDVPDKGKYCIEHNIDILIDDNIYACLEAQRLGVRAILVVSKHNLARAGEVRYGGANWKQIGSAVEAIRSIIGRREAA